jgi:Cu-Zn family superoxide dismutase
LVAAFLILALGIGFSQRWRKLASETGPIGAFGGRGDPDAGDLLGDDTSDSAATEGYLGHVILKPMNGTAAAGSITFSVTAGALRISAVVEHATPGEHGLAIHSETVCPKAGRAAAGHLDALGDQHGAPNTTTRHVGDLGNIAVGPDGRGELTLYLHPSAYPEERRTGWRAILGKTVMLHAQRDDLNSQPDGRAGLPVACGVVVRQAGGPHH